MNGFGWAGVSGFQAPFAALCSTSGRGGVAITAAPEISVAGLMRVATRLMRRKNCNVRARCCWNALDLPVGELGARRFIVARPFFCGVAV